MSGHLVWLAGRGVSMSCGLCWDVPQCLEHAFHRGEIDRAELTARICREAGMPGLRMAPEGASAEQGTHQ
jgi:hypothetical protein